MRFTIPAPTGGVLDVEVETGVLAGDLRRRLALLTGDARWAGAALEVRGRVLDEHHPAGAPPLLPGAHLGPAVTPDDVEAAVAAGMHVAVLGGATTGRVVALQDGGCVHVVVSGAAAGPARAEGGGRVRVEVSRRGPRVRVRVLGGQGALVRRHRRATGGRRDGAGTRPLGRLPRTWPPEGELRVGGATLQLRETHREGAGPRRPPRRVPPWAWPAVASAAGGVTLAVALRQPLLLLTAFTGLVALLGLRAGDRLGAADAGRETGGHGRTRADEGPAPVGPAPAAGAANPADVAALRLETARRLRDDRGPVAGGAGPWPADRTIALVGERREVLAAARALVLLSLGAGTTTRLVVRTASGADWRWARWWEPDDRLPEAQDEDVLVVSDDAGDDLGAWRVAAPRARLLLLVPEGARVPAWVATVVPTAPGPPRLPGPGAGRSGPVDDGPVLRARSGGTTPGVEPVAPDVADDQARAAAALGWLVAAGGTAAAPPDVALGGLPGTPSPDAAAVAEAWGRVRERGSLASPVGAAPDGRPVVLDLVRDGPHALVAGTTGAGKSELLTTLVLGLTLSHPPRRLAVLLVDFKGGTGLGPLAGLPHVVDHVHDLDVASARRTLVGLRAETRRRERLLAAAGCRDVAELDPDDPGTPARLLVVVDELRALVDDLPDAAAALARLAAQGRGLGIHLVLATQRPGGAVPADLRANVTLRIALRVADDEESRDVVGVPDAARLDAAVPGRALVRVGSRPPTLVQVARARRRRADAPVRLVPTTPARTRRPAPWRPAPALQDDVAEWVGACREVARGLAGPGVPWLPALPSAIVAAEAVTDDGLLLAVADVPDEQRRSAVRWRLGHGPLLVLGGPRSGRSTALVTAGTHALLAGAHVHTVGLPDDAVGRLRATAADRVGTVLPVDDPHRALLLLHRLTSRTAAHAPPDVLLVDGLDAVLESLATHARGAGVDLLTALVRRPPADVHLAAAGPVVPSVQRLLGSFAVRLVLPVPDATLDAHCGVPVALSGPRPVPGRAVACTADGAHLCQVVLPSRATVPCVTTTPGASSGGDGQVLAGPARTGPVRIAPLPDHVTTARCPGVPLPLGVGGDDGSVVAVDPTRPLVVAGPPGSGRTTALRTLAQAWAATGRPTVLLTVGGPSDGDDGATTSAGVTHLAWQAAASLLDDLLTVTCEGSRDGEGTSSAVSTATVTTAIPVTSTATTTGTGPAEDAGSTDGTGSTRGSGSRDTAASRGTVLLVDDADLLERTAPRLVDRLTTLQGDPARRLVVAALATTATHAAGAYGGPVAHALRARQVLVLDPHGPAAGELLGAGAELHTDPWHRPAGRGVLRRDRVLTRVQVHVPGRGVRHAGAEAVVERPAAGLSPPRGDHPT